MNRYKIVLISVKSVQNRKNERKVHAYLKTEWHVQFQRLFLLEKTFKIRTWISVYWPFAPSVCPSDDGFLLYIFVVGWYSRDMLVFGFHHLVTGSSRGIVFGVSRIRLVASLGTASEKNAPWKNPTLTRKHCLKNHPRESEITQNSTTSPSWVTCSVTMEKIQVPILSSQSRKYLYLHLLTASRTSAD